MALTSIDVGAAGPPRDGPFDDQRRDVVTFCTNCPYYDGEYGDCGADYRHELSSVDAKDMPPTWCPLRAGPVTVELEAGS